MIPGLIDCVGEDVVSDVVKYLGGVKGQICRMKKCYTGASARESLEIASKDGSCGYFIVRQTDLAGEGIKEAMEEYIQDYRQRLGMNIIREFVDHEKGIAGFSWRRR